MCARERRFDGNKSHFRSSRGDVGVFIATLVGFLMQVLCVAESGRVGSRLSKDKLFRFWYFIVASFFFARLLYIVVSETSHSKWWHCVGEGLSGFY